MAQKDKNHTVREKTQWSPVHSYVYLNLANISLIIS